MELIYTQPDPELHSSYAEPTSYCTFSSLQTWAQELVENSRTEEEKAVRIFNWVRDNVHYELGIIPDTAEETFKRRSGSCTNKANLLVALSRAVGIPAAFHTMRVKTKLYFGAVCTPRFAQFMSDESFHIYSAMYINGQWVKCDSTDDQELSKNCSHLCSQSKLVEFNGREDAILNLEPEHIVVDDLTLYPNVDAILARRPRLSSEILGVMNLFLIFIRRFGLNYPRIEPLERDFFQWLHGNRPKVYATFLNAEEALQPLTLRNPEKVVASESMGH